MQFFIGSMRKMLCVFFLMVYANSESLKADITPPNLRRTVNKQLPRISCDKLMPLSNKTTGSQHKFILAMNEFEITQPDKAASLPDSIIGNRRKFAITRERKGQ